MQRRAFESGFLSRHLAALAADEGVGTTFQAALNIGSIRGST
jgi:hypothetical protein